VKLAIVTDAWRTRLNGVVISLDDRREKALARPREHPTHIFMSHLADARSGAHLAPGRADLGRAGALVDQR
jgi:hypothetical protein